MLFSKTLFASCVLTSLNAVTAMAGTAVSGGGPGIFCPASVIGQPPVQTLDLFEGRRAGLKITESTTPYLQQIAQVIPRLSFDWSLQADVWNSVDHVLGHIEFLPKGLSINAPSDLGTTEAVVLPTGCSMGGIGYYEAKDILTVSTDAFEALSETDKAAFLFHEAFYRLIRLRNPEPWDSKPTRKFVSRLFEDVVDAKELALLGVAARWNFRMFDFQLPYSIAPALGKESYFTYTQRLSPMKLPMQNGVFEIRFRKPVLNASIFCKPGVYPYAGERLLAVETNQNVTSVSAQIPIVGCEVVGIQMMTSSTQTQIVEAELWYDNQKMAVLKTNSFYSGSMWAGFPIYW